MNPPFVSILIPCRKVDQFVLECIDYCNKLSYGNFEVILLPDAPATLDGIKVVPTGPVLPGRKRNLGATVASGEILAYIDADAYPRRDWLTNAIHHLQEDRVGAVGGPAITASNDSKLCQAQGFVLSSFLMGGVLSARYKELGVQETDDIHSVNLVAWRRVVEKVAGWNEKYWPGEDTLFCLGIKKAGYKQLLASDVVVYHHRRPRIAQYLGQIGGFGVHRGFFAKRYPENSRKVGFFIPFVLLVGLVVGPLLSLAFPLMWWVYVGGVVVYVSLLGAATVKDGHKMLRVFVLLLLTHLTYGVGFIRGLLASDLSK